MRILVTGGKGYIGEITAKKLIEQNHNVFIYDKKDGQNGDKCTQDCVSKLFPNITIRVEVSFPFRESFLGTFPFFRTFTHGRQLIARSQAEQNSFRTYV